ncbi:MAG: ATP-dependent helicase, partial [Treponema sp.]|nr:ATP-dependent helicase [Treponema sp.]
MEIFDNVSHIIKTDLELSIERGSRLSIAAACFSIYAYQALKKQLDGIAGLRFIFTSPAFVAEKAPKEKREFYIPRLNRERSLYGTEFEVKLRNELSQKAVARECAEWIKKKALFRSNTTGGGIDSLLDVTNTDNGYSYAPIGGFTTSELGLERGNYITHSVIKFPHSESRQLVESFGRVWNDKSLLQDVTDEVIDSITAAYNENS